MTDWSVPKHTKIVKNHLLLTSPLKGEEKREVVVPYETTANSMNLTKNHIFKPEIGQLNIKVAKISQIIKTVNDLQLTIDLNKPVLLDHKTKIKAINKNISLEYKEIDVKSE